MSPTMQAAICSVIQSLKPAVFGNRQELVSLARAAFQFKLCTSDRVESRRGIRKAFIVVVSIGRGSDTGREVGRIQAHSQIHIILEEAPHHVASTTSCPCRTGDLKQRTIPKSIRSR